MAVPKVLVGDIITLRAWCISASQASVNTFHYRCTSIGGAGGSTHDAALAFDAAIEAQLKAIISTQAEYRGVQCYVNHLPLPLPQSTVANAGVGSGGATQMATQVCAMTSWLTDFAGPGLRGRTYWPFISTSEDANPGQPSPGLVTAVTTLSNQIIAFTTFGVGGDTSSVSLWLKQGVNKHGVLQPGQLITDFTVPVKFGTQRKRGEGYGRPNSSPI